MDRFFFNLGYSVSVQISSLTTKQRGHLEKKIRVIQYMKKYFFKYDVNNLWYTDFREFLSCNPSIQHTILFQNALWGFCLHNITTF